MYRVGFVVCCFLFLLDVGCFAIKIDVLLDGVRCCWRYRSCFFRCHVYVAFDVVVICLLLLLSVCAYFLSLTLFLCFLGGHFCRLWLLL